MACEVRQESDEMVCKCGLRWDVNDPEPPACHKNRRRNPADAAPRSLPANVIATMPASIPVELPAHVADAMRAAYIARIGSTGSGRSAMQAAYRVFLDNLP